MPRTSSRRRWGNSAIRFQEWVAESLSILPLSVVLAAIVWSFPLWDQDPGTPSPVSSFQGDDSWLRLLPFLGEGEWLRLAGLLLGFLTAILTTVIISETNNLNKIIRIRTRLMAVSWLLLVMCVPAVHSFGAPLVCTCLYAVSIMLLFSVWQTDAPVRPVFHCMLSLGVASLFWAPMLLVSATVFLHVAGTVRSFSWRGFWAGILGLLLPYWFWAVWALWTNSFPRMFSHLAGPASWSLPTLADYAQWPVALWLAWGLMALPAVVGAIHFLLTVYSDKLRVRSLLRLYLLQALFLQVLFFLLPASWPVVLPMLAVSATPFTAHLFALVRNRLCALFLCLILLCAFLLILSALFQPQLLVAAL